MSQMKADRPVTYLAGGVMASRFRFVNVTAAYTVNYAGAGAVVDGVNLDTATAAGLGIAVANPGSGQSFKIEASAAIAAGAPLKAAANGKAVTAAGADKYYARALEAALADGDIIEAQWQAGGGAVA